MIFQASLSPFWPQSVLTLIFSLLAIQFPSPFFIFCWEATLFHLPWFSISIPKSIFQISVSKSSDLCVLTKDSSFFFKQALLFGFQDLLRRRKGIHGCYFHHSKHFNYPWFLFHSQMGQGALTDDIFISLSQKAIFPFSYAAHLIKQNNRNWFVWSSAACCEETKLYFRDLSPCFHIIEALLLSLGSFPQGMWSAICTSGSLCS